MGQYFVLVNEDREEYVNPHGLGSGMKLVETLTARGDYNSVGDALAFLVMDGPDDGLTAMNDLSPIAGSWAGDSIRLVGDYADGDLYYRAQEEFDDMTMPVRRELTESGGAFEFAEPWNDKYGSDN